MRLTKMYVSLQISKLRCNNVFSHVSIIVGSEALRVEPSKLKVLLSRHLATNSFGLGRLFYKKSSRHLQHYRHHGDQNGRNLEGWGVSNQFTICFHPLSPMNESLTLSYMYKVPDFVQFFHFTFLYLRVKAQQYFVDLSCILLFRQENSMLKIWLNPSWVKLNHLLKNQSQEFCFV